MNEANQNQIAAADPALNTWLTANAGSGKTRVLTDRVARLLLGGADPLGILCLTYTKAAAAEMQNRLFKTLGKWAMAPDDQLRNDLAGLGEEGDLSSARLRKARQLFAKAIETPGGIRIQTIHSFCAALLRRFPLEANVSPAFTEIDDRSAGLLRDDILETMALGRDAGVLDGLLAHASGDLGALTDQLITLRSGFDAAATDQDLRDALSIPAGLDQTAVLAQAFDGSEADLIAALLPHLARGKDLDLKAHAKLSALLPFQPSLAGMAVLEGLLVAGAGTGDDPFRPKKAQNVPTKDLLPADHPLRQGWADLRDRLITAKPDRLTLALYEKTLALYHFARPFLARYRAAKDRRGWLDFDDLIEKATGLLTDPSLSAWVLYRLDGGIAHVLVDEAQDTSPAQWRLIDLLTAEMTAGLGSHDRPRTLFVVGDKKQSIYSFQGADVSAFDEVRARFSLAFGNVGTLLNERPLRHSFRSSPAILRLVDQCFVGDRTAAMGGTPEHEAFYPDLPGRVDFWPPVPAPEKADSGAWFQPEDRTGAPGAETVLAGQIAGEIRAMIDAGQCIPDAGDMRPMHEGDFLILVRRRKVLFEEIIRACKSQGLQIAGADRLTLTKELAVRDVLALLSFLNTPDDDLSLAAVLRSPLLGMSEDGLFRLAHGRPGFLWEKLRNDAGLADIKAILDDLRNQADYLRPHELIDRILTRHNGRRLLLGRLGEEAADGLDELLSQALAYEQVDVPSLTGFLVWMASGDVEAKRQAESKGRRIRVMTVHGAKGLEAPIVILPDCADRRPPNEPSVVLADGLPIWAMAKTEATPQQLAAQDARAQKREAESLRLLYVAVTRAQCWLIVAAAGSVSDACWYGMLRIAAGQLPVFAMPDQRPPGLERHQFGDWPAPRIAAVPNLVPEILPTWASTPASAAVAAVRTLSPSGLGGEKTNAGEAAGDPDALSRGTVLHQLLEHFPRLDAADRAALATAIDASAAVVARAQGLLDDPGLSWIFGPDSLAEVGFSVAWAGQYLAGSIDRLIVADGVVTVIDYKSNAVVPDGPATVPEGYLRQMGAYAFAMAALYPGWRIDVAILWTQTGQVMRLDPDIVSAALLRATTA